MTSTVLVVVVAVGASYGGYDGEVHRAACACDAGKARLRCLQEYCILHWVPCPVVIMNLAVNVNHKCRDARARVQRVVKIKVLQQTLVSGGIDQSACTHLE
jgi:hypothetical protein